MRRLCQFFSYALLTQVVLLLNQIVLLPAQLRMWGTDATASWYAAVAVATITTFADFGLRTAGHPELLRFVKDGDDSARAHIEQIWGWIRVSVGLVALFIWAWLVLATWVHAEGSLAVWKGTLTVAYSIETLLTIRIVFLDSLGQYNEAELSYFIFAVLRFGLAVPGLLVLKLGPNGLAWLFLITSCMGIALQAGLCKTLSVFGLFDRLPSKLSLKVIATARHTMAEPLSNWLRLGLPVLVVASVSTPTAVAMYVALRAVFGASRTTIQQLARVASVEYLRLRAGGEENRARTILTGFVQGASLFGLAVGGLVIVDNLRLLGLFLKHFDRAVFPMIVASFGFSGAFYSYQVLVNVMFRIGDLAEIAHRQYAFVVYTSVFSLVSILLKSLPLFLALVVLAEIVLAASIMVLRRNRKTTEYLVGRRGLAGSFGGLVVISVLWIVVLRPDGILMSSSLAHTWVSVVTLVGYAAALAIFHSVLNSDLYSIVGRAKLTSVFTSSKIAD